MKRLLLFGGGLALGAGLLIGGRRSTGAVDADVGAGALPQAAKLRVRRSTRKIVYHSTSRSFTRRVMQQSGLDDARDPRFLEAAVERYRRTGAEHFANLLVVPDGASTWLAHPDRATSHTVTPANLRARAAEPGWWRQRWPGVRNAIDLIDLKPGEYINNITVSIDVVPLPDEGRLIYTAESLDAAAQAGRDLARRYGLSLDRRDHLAHADLDPWARGTEAGGGWDPGWDWVDFMRRIAPAGQV